MEICNAFWEMHDGPSLCYAPLRDSKRVTKGYFSSGASAFWAMSLAPSITSVISTVVSSTFRAVIRSSGTDSAKPHLPPAFLPSVESAESSHDHWKCEHVHHCYVTTNLTVLSFSNALLMSSVISETLTLAILLHLMTFNMLQKHSWCNKLSLTFKI